ncbi:MAG: alpha-ketoglutarate-dependent dioxygenase AlkB [Rubrivivax sp.]|nr:MAG: alpha-ketoglutarate-dependent dioxygenase AlkB [Rubrivivax sp.]
MPQGAPPLLEDQLSLFDPGDDLGLPEGLRYEPDFLSEAEEAHWLGQVRGLDLAPMRYKSYLAKRRVISFGGRYDFDDNRLEPTADLPENFHPLRQKVADWLGRPPTDLVQVLVAEYSPGTPLGWHRDVPEFEDIAGVSLLSEATMRFRPYPPGAPARSDVLKLVLAPRSIYRLSGPSRWAWQHSVVPTRALRYSVTFRTAR